MHPSGAFRGPVTGVKGILVAGDEGHIWVRSIAYVCPNVVQLCGLPLFPLDLANGEEREYPVIATRWRVPIDDTHTVQFTYVYLDHNAKEAYFEMPWPADISSAGGRSYEEMQREPGDLEAQVGQPPIAIHSTEHLATSDLGLAMMRRMIREGIETVKRGEDPRSIPRAEAPEPIYARETMIRAGYAGTPHSMRNCYAQARATYMSVRCPLQASHEMPKSSAS